MSSKIQKKIIENEEIFQILTKFKEAFDLTFSVLKIDPKIFDNKENPDHQALFDILYVLFLKLFLYLFKF